MDQLQPEQGSSSKYHYSLPPKTTPSQPSRPSVTNFDLSSLVEQNNLAEDSCLLVIDNKVYDLTLWLQDHLSCNLHHNLTHPQPTTTDNSPHPSSPASPPPSPLLQRSPASANNISSSNTQISHQPNQFDHLLQTARHDPVEAGYLLRSIYQDQPFTTDGSTLQDWLSDYRIGDFNPSSTSTPNSPYRTIDQASSRSLAPSMSSSRSTNTAGTSIHRANPVGQPSHLDRANELVRISKQRVIDAQRGVGIANLSLADAFAQLVEAEKVKDHLVLQASEGYRPVWHPWTKEDTH